MVSHRVTAHFMYIHNMFSMFFHVSNACITAFIQGVSHLFLYHVLRGQCPLFNSWFDFHYGCVSVAHKVYQQQFQLLWLYYLVTCFYLFPFYFKVSLHVGWCHISCNSRYISNRIALVSIAFYFVVLCDWSYFICITSGAHYVSNSARSS